METVEVLVTKNFLSPLSRIETPGPLTTFYFPKTNLPVLIRAHLHSSAAVPSLVLPITFHYVLEVLFELLDTKYEQMNITVIYTHLTSSRVEQQLEAID